MITINAKLMTLDQVAAEMDVSRDTVRRWCSTGKLEADKIYGQWMVDPADLVRYKEQRKEKRKNRRVVPGQPFSISNTKKPRSKPLAHDRPNMLRIHALADKAVAARMAFINLKFPPGNGSTYQEVYEYVLYNMPPHGQRYKEKKT